MLAFGPVPSRRLGMSLGVNHIPPKYCTYACVYCQVGRTDHLTITRREFFPVEEVVRQVEEKVHLGTASGVKIDYLTLVPDGEPALDLNLGEIITRLKNLKIPVAVISNASLIDRAEVQEALSKADWVSLKVDSVDEQAWHRINRPHHHLCLSAILAGIQTFKQQYNGTLVTESMLAAGINDSPSAIRKLRDYLCELQPYKAYLAIPIRPPAETWVKPPDPVRLAEILAAFSEKVPFLDLLFEAEKDDFTSTGNLEEDILGITSVHPIREQPLRRMVSLANGDWQIVEELLRSEQLLCFSYGNEKFYLRRFSGHTFTS